MSEGNHNINSKDFLIGSLIGGIVGASIALLLAPKSGKELRTEINEQASNIKKKTYDISHTAKERGSELVELAKTKSEQISKAVNEKSAPIIEKIRERRQKEEKETDEVAIAIDEEADTALSEAEKQPETYEEPVAVETK